MGWTSAVPPDRRRSWPPLGEGGRELAGVLGFNLSPHDPKDKVGVDHPLQRLGWSLRKASFSEDRRQCVERHAAS